jgi:hypothetical protein
VIARPLLRKSWLTTLCNVLVLNLVLIAASLPLLTAPAAVSAASATLDRWCREGEEQVVREFLSQFRCRWSLRTALGAGTAILAGQDPIVLLLGLPVFLLYALKLTAGPGLRRAGLRRGGSEEAAG